MPANFVRASANASGTNSTNVSTTLDCSGSNYLIAFVYTDNDSTEPSSLVASYNSVSLSFLGSGKVGTGNGPFVYCYGLANPSTDNPSYTVDFSWSSPTTRSICAAMCFSGVGSIGTLDFGGLSAGTTSVTTSVTLGSNDIMAGVCAYASNNAGNISVTTGTERTETVSSAQILSTATNTGTGSTSIVWSRAASAEASYIGVPILGLTRRVFNIT